jgi:transposase, IS6 family
MATPIRSCRSPTRRCFRPSCSEPRNWRFLELRQKNASQLSLASGATIDFLLSAKRDAAADERFLAKALVRANHPTPRVINTDKHAAYPPAIVQLKDEGVLEENCQHRPVQYLNNVLEQDHRAIKRRINASQHFRSFWGAWRTIAGYEAIHMIRKGQACWSAMGTGSGLLHRFVLGMFGIEV